MKNQKAVFQRDSLWPLLFVITMMSHNYIFSKYPGGYKFTKSLEKINLIEDIKLFVKKLEKIGGSNTNNKNT